MAKKRQKQAVTNAQLLSELRSLRRLLRSSEENRGVMEYERDLYRKYCRVFASGQPINESITAALAEWNGSDENDRLPPLVAVSAGIPLAGALAVSPTNHQIEVTFEVMQSSTITIGDDD